MSQHTLIRELPLDRNDESIIDIEGRAEVLSVFPIIIEKNNLFSGDSLFRIELINNEFDIIKKYINHRDINSFYFYGISGTNSLILSFLDDDIQGVFMADNRVFVIERHGEKYYMVLLDHSVMHENCANIESSNIQTPIDYNNEQEDNMDSELVKNQQFGVRDHDGSGDIKVLVLYTPAAKNSVSNIYNTAILAEALSNQSFANSGVNCKIEIVYIGETDYVESSSSNTDVKRFKRTDDGYMDEVHALRVKYSADVCVLLADLNDNCGEAFTIKADYDEAFCVVKALYCATGNYTFIHEIGHLMGCMHDNRCDPRLWPYVYGHGYVYPDGGWRTIMAYDDYCSGCVRLPYWSNPDVTYDGVSMGTSVLNNNTKVWNVRYGEVGAFENISNNVTITSSTIPGSLNYGFIEADSNVGISGNVSLNSGQSLTIKAGNEIVFSDGFESSAGSELNAYISQQPAALYATAPAPLSINVAHVRRIDATEIINTVVVYPNPTMDELIIQTNGKENPLKIVIMDVMGKQIMKLDSPTDAINISQVPTGIYFINIEFVNRSERYRIIKK